MKKKIMLILAMIFILSPALMACTANSPSESTSQPGVTSTERVNVADILGRDWDEVSHLFGDVERISETLGTYGANSTWKVAPSVMVTTTGFREDTTYDPESETWVNLDPPWVNIIVINYQETENAMVVEDYTDSINFHFNDFDHTTTRAQVEAVFGTGDQHTGYAGYVGSLSDGYLFFWQDDFGAIAFDFDSNDLVARILIGQITNNPDLAIGLRR